jgi:hypothetical protein
MYDMTSSFVFILFILDLKNLARISQCIWEGNLPRIITPVLRGGTFWFGDVHFVFEMPVLILIFLLLYPEGTRSISLRYNFFIL